MTLSGNSQATRLAKGITPCNTRYIGGAPKATDTNRIRSRRETQPDKEHHPFPTAASPEGNN